MSRRRRRVAAAVDCYAPPGRLTWEPYTIAGKCDTCKAPATWALVRLHPLGTVATSLIRLACQGHRA